MMHPADIICALTKAGYSQTDVATKLGLDRSGVNLVIHGNAKSLNVATCIATLTNIPLNKLWPGKYTQPKQAA